MKKILNLVLAACTIGLLFAVWFSIQNDIDFDNERKARESVVKERLIQISKAEEQYKKVNGYYCGTLDSLIDFVKNGRAVDKVIKEGELSDDQLEAGMTEREAVAKGLIRRDTIWKSASELLGIPCPDSLKYIPIGRPADGTFKVVTSEDGEQHDSVYYGMIQLRKKDVINPKTMEVENLVEFRAALDDYLFGMSEKKIKGLKSELKKSHNNHAELMFDFQDDLEGEWYGLRMGDLMDTANKMNGNWE